MYVEKLQDIYYKYTLREELTLYNMNSNLKHTVNVKIRRTKYCGLLIYI